MKIKEFFESKERLCIHCDTEEKAIKLCNEFDRLGYKWINGYSYKEDNIWERFKENTCYSNSFNYSPITKYKENGYKILEFEDIEFEDSGKEYIKSTMEENESKRIPEYKANGVSWEEYDKIYQENQELKEIIIELSKEKHHIREMIKDYLDKEEK